MSTRFNPIASCVASSFVAIATIATLTARDAYAFDAKHAPNGALVRWGASRVDFALSPTLDDIGAGARAAAVQAVASWADAEGAPALHTYAGTAKDAPGYDGKNIVTYASGGYAPAGSALAVTVLTYDDATGRIVDCDIVLNGKYKFANLDAAARAARGAAGISTEGGGSVHTSAKFDLVHVLAHETGHALGLNDEPSQGSALMYPFTLPDDASIRVPEADDLAGVATLYATPMNDTAAKAGCSASGHGASDWISVALIAGAIAVPLLRRRRALLPVIALGAIATLAAFPARARTASTAVHTSAEVVASSVVLHDGLFATELVVAMRDCDDVACPAYATTTVWGGSAGGVTQEISGSPRPSAVSVGRRLTVTLDPQTPERVALLAE